MNFRTTLYFAIISLLISACNFTMAQDVTPPPGYVAPTPAPTQGPVYPEQNPNVQNGALIYAEKCAACHGATGLGDGEQGQALPVSVPPLGVFEVAAKAAPADWYRMVTLGNIDNFMPPFASLRDQERWDVVAYAMTLSSTPGEISRGEQLFKDICGDCPIDFFASQEKMASLSTNDLVRVLPEGGGDIPALGDSLSIDELGAIAIYLRTLTLTASSQSLEPAPVSVAPEVAQTEAPSEGETSVESTQQAGTTPEALPDAFETGSITGNLVMRGDGEIPSGITVNLLGFEHGGATGGSPVEVVDEIAEADSNGVYLFDDIPLIENHIYYVVASHQGIFFESEFVFSEAGVTELTIPELELFESTTETGGLVIEQLHISFDMAIEGGVQVFELFTISNLSDKAYTFTPEETSLPFMPLPEGATNVGFELSQDSAPLLPTEDGFAIPPSQDFYSIIAFFSMPYETELTLRQPFVLPVNSALVIVPEGIKVKTDDLADDGEQQTQQGFTVQMFTGAGLPAGDSLELELSGKPKRAAQSPIELGSQQTLLIGAGAIGVALILAGVWMFLHDRGKLEDDFFEEDDLTEFESAEDVMDAILALDDLHRAKKIPDEAYHLRREELKELLKELV